MAESPFTLVMDDDVAEGLGTMLSTCMRLLQASRADRRQVCALVCTLLAETLVQFTLEQAWTRQEALTWLETRFVPHMLLMYEEAREETPYG